MKKFTSKPFIMLRGGFDGIRSKYHAKIYNVKCIFVGRKLLT